MKNILNKNIYVGKPVNVLLIIEKFEKIPFIFELMDMRSLNLWKRIKNMIKLKKTCFDG